MKDYIGDEYPKSPIHRLFEEGEDDLALEYLIQSHKDGFKIIGIAEEDESGGFLPEEFMDTIYRSFMKSMYGVNITTIANMWKVQTTFMDKYQPLLMEYLQYTKTKAEYYEFIPNAFAIPFMQHKAGLGIMMPQMHWNPMSKLKSMYVEDKEANLVSPFNIFVNAKLVITNPTDAFLECAIPNDDQREEFRRTAKAQGKDMKVLYSLLPNDNFNKILNVIDMIHRYI